MVNRHLRIIFLRLLIHSQDLQNFWAAEISNFTVYAVELITFNQLKVSKSPYLSTT